MLKQEDIQSLLDETRASKIGKATEKQLDGYQKLYIHANNRYRKVRSPYGVFRSATAAAKHFETNKEYIKSLCDKKEKGFSFLAADTTEKITKHPTPHSLKIKSTTVIKKERIKYVKSLKNIPTANECIKLFMKKFNLSRNNAINSVNVAFKELGYTYEVKREYETTTNYEQFIKDNSKLDFEEFAYKLEKTFEIGRGYARQKSHQLRRKHGLEAKSKNSKTKIQIFCEFYTKLKKKKFSDDEIRKKMCKKFDITTRQASGRLYEIKQKILKTSVGN